jgi:hypothetical protein
MVFTNPQAWQRETIFGSGLRWKNFTILGPQTSKRTANDHFNAQLRSKSPCNKDLRANLPASDLIKRAPRHERDVVVGEFV